MTRSDPSYRRCSPSVCVCVCVCGGKRGKGRPISASPYVWPLAVFVFTCPDGVRWRDVFCDHIAARTREKRYPDFIQITPVDVQISKKNPDLTSLLVMSILCYTMLSVL